MPPKSPSTKSGPHARHKPDCNIESTASSPPHSSFSMDPEIADEIQQAAITVSRNFDRCSCLRNDARAKIVAAFGPSELLLGPPSSSPFFSSSKHTKGDNRFLWCRLRKIELQDPDEEDSHFDDQMEDNREKVAEWCDGDHCFIVKFVNTAILGKDITVAKEAAAALVMEAKILANLPKHPHIVQVHGIHRLGPSAGFCGRIPSENYFTIVDEISETLQQRLTAWRRREQGYETDRFDDMEKQQSEITQRLEIVVDVVSALEWLSGHNLVFLFNPTKAGFDSRLDRVKLFDFGSSVESGKKPLFDFNRANDSYQNAYTVSSVLRGQRVCLPADVYAIGMLLWEVIHLKAPFHNLTPDQYDKEVVELGRRPHLSRDLPSSIRKLMKGCWSSDKLLSMKDVHDQLEELLLDGIDFRVKSRKTSTRSKSSNNIRCAQDDDDEKKNLIRGSRSRKIKYQKRDERSVDGGTADVKSTRSKETSGSHSTQRSKESHSSRGSRDLKKFTSPSMRSRKSNHTFISDNQAPRQVFHQSPSMDKIQGKSPSSSRSLNRKILKSSRKLKRDKSKQKTEKGSKSQRSRGSAKEKLQSKTSPRSGTIKAPKRPKSMNNLSMFEKKRDGTGNFLESMKKQVASIQRNILGEDDVSQGKQSLGENQPRSRGVRRLSSRRQSSRRLNARSSSRDLASPANKMPSVSPGRSRRSLSRGASTGSLRSPAETFRSSSRESLRGMAKVPSRRVVRKSASGLETVMIGSLGDPSRSRAAPPRSKSTTFASSPLSRQFSNSPAHNIRRKSHDNAFGLNGLQLAHEQLLRDGKDSAKLSNQNHDSFVFLSPSSDDSRRGKLKATPSGGLIKASSKDLALGFGARTKSIQKSQETSSRSLGGSSTPVVRKLSKSQRQSSRRAFLEAQ